MPVENFLVLAEMSRRDQRIYFSDEIVSVKKVKAGTLIEIGMGMDLIGRIASGEVVGGLLLWDKEQFRELKAELDGIRAAQVGEESRKPNPAEA